jgi:hypothetical protein
MSGSLAPPPFANETLYGLGASVKQNECADFRGAQMLESERMHRFLNCVLSVVCGSPLLTAGQIYGERELHEG